MKGTKAAVFFLITCCVSARVFGQYYFYNDRFIDSDVVFELGGSIGAMNCVTDIAGQNKFAKKKYLNEINWQTTNLNAGIYLGALYRNCIGARLEFTAGRVHSYDSLLERGSPRYVRNLSFRSDIKEISLLIEFHPVFLLHFEENPPFISPYLVGGGGFFRFNPQGQLNGQWIDLHPLSLEGQGFPEYPDRRPYRLTQSNVSAGVGIKYELAPTVNLRIEWLNRYLFTDYLDDVSLTYIDPSLFNKYLSPADAALARTLYMRGKRNNKNRGEKENKDTYFTLNLKLGFTFGRPRR